MCNCGGKRRALATARVVSVPAPAPEPTGRSVVAAVAPAPPRRLGIRRRGHAPPPPPAPAFHLPIVDTKIWGPRLWTVLHVVSIAICSHEMWPRLVEELKMALPCPDCTEHYTAWVNAQPVTATTDMSAWFLTLHNDVNRRTGGKGWTYDAMNVVFAGQFANARTALNALKDVMGATAWATLDGLLTAAITPDAEPVVTPVLEVTEVVA